MDMSDTARVIAPPPLLLVAALVVGTALDQFAPLGLLAIVPGPLRLAVGGAIAIAAFGLAATASRHFRRLGTPVKPWQPTTRLVTDGVMGRLRNPMYVGMVLVTWGVGLMVAGDWLLVAGVALAALLHWGAVLREERYLEARFGDEYRRYRGAVPRYGLRGLLDG